MMPRHPLAYRVVERFGIKTAVAVQTLMICAVAVLVTALTLNLFAVQEQTVALALSLCCPAVIAPPATYSFLKMHVAMVEREHELEAALAEVRELNELLPICCCCKKIRDDDGYWQSVENYITSHSRSRFSHGICPECAKQQYGEWLAEDQGERGTE